jgi:hypothetical protein
VNLSRARTAADSSRVIPTGYRARASLATNVRGEFAQLGYFNAGEAGATVPRVIPTGSLLFSRELVRYCINRSSGFFLLEF